MGTTGTPRLLRALAGGGFLLFGAFFLVATLRPAFLEDRARQFVVQHTVAQLEESLLTPQEDATGLAGLAGRITADAEFLRPVRDGRLAAWMMERLSLLCHYDCDAVPLGVEGVDANEAEATGPIQRLRRRAFDWSSAYYSDTVVSLTRELRIFAGVNAVLFLLVLTASLGSPETQAGLRLPLWLLLAATLAAILGYLLLQDWFYTILFGRFVGFGYLAWVGLIFVALGDCVINRARLTRFLLQRDR